MRSHGGQEVMNESVEKAVNQDFYMKQILKN